MKKKDIILSILGIIFLIVIAFFIASFIHDNNLTDNANKKETESINKEESIVDGVKIPFKTYRVDQKFFLNVPSDFEKLDLDSLNQKYNYSERPGLVFESNDDLKHVLVTNTNETMTDEDLNSYLNSKVSSITNMEILDNKTYNKYNKTFAKLIVIDDKTYYNFRFFTIENKLVTVEFNISLDIYKKWESVINEVMDSICFNEEDIKKYSNE